MEQWAMVRTSNLRHPARELSLLMGGLLGSPPAHDEWSLMPPMTLHF